MDGQVSIKAILVGLLVKLVAGGIFGGIAGGIAGAISVGSMVRTLPKNGAVNSVQSTQMATNMMTNIFSSPLFIVGTILGAVLAALLAGYVTGLLAPGAEMKNVAIVTAIFAAFAILTSLRAPAMTPATAPMMSALASLRWSTLVANVLSIPALLAGGALAARRSAPSPQLETFDRFQR